MSTTFDRLTAALSDRYRIERELGQGGMATVYLAHDLKHQRDVAIKVLHPDLGAALGSERFLTEIRTTARLQHPHILPLLDSGEADGQLYYVMPLVTGETLRTRLERERQLPIDAAVLIAREVADALGYAHSLGVIHRDIKPENILLQGGHALVADFGIALAVQSAGGQRMTQTGLSLGTPQYMSPEQAMGERAIDARSDIYALGAVTYEMLAGDPPFTGSSVQAIVAKVMTEKPTPIRTVRDTIPAQVEAAVLMALAKLPADRFASAREFALALQGKGDAATLSQYLPAGGSEAPRKSRRRFWREAAAWATAALAIAALAWVRFHPPTTPDTPVVRMTIDAAPGERLMVGAFPIVLSSKGDRLAYVTQGSAGYRTVVRRTSELGGEVTIAAQSLRYYVFSPDGRWLAYVAGKEVRRIPSGGGASETLGNAGTRTIVGLAWAATDTILIGTDNGLLTMSARGGPTRLATDSASAQQAFFPVVMPDGKTALVTAGSSRAAARIVAISLATGGVTDIGLNGARAFGLVHGHIVYQTSNLDLAAVPFDLQKLRVTGDAVPIESGVDGVGLSPSGTLAYMPGASATRLVLAGGGSDEPVRSEAAQYDSPRFSPDGRKIAVTIETKDAADVWVYDRTANTFSRMTTSGENTAPEWTPDGRRILYKSFRDGKSTIMWVPADGSGKADTLFDAGWDLNEAIMSPDSRWLVVRTPPGEARHRDIFALQLEGERTLVPMATGPASEQMPRLSPDGKWLAYQSDESGRFEIYVRPFPNEGARVQVSSVGGTEPLWDRTGRTLYYRAPDGITANAVMTGARFSIGARRLMLPGRDPAAPTHPAYDVAPDGVRFLVLRPAGGESKAIVIHNWQREFREKLLGAKP